jgi:hypothetical protein
MYTPSTESSQLLKVFFPGLTFLLSTPTFTTLRTHKASLELYLSILRSLKPTLLSLRTQFLVFSFRI